LQSCQAREAAIKNRKEALIKLVETQLETMDGWVESFKKFLSGENGSGGQKCQ